MKIFKKQLQIGFVLLLSLLFVYCSSDSVIGDKDKDGVKGKATHTYDIKLTKGSDVIHYKGSITPKSISEDFMSLHGYDIEDGFPAGTKGVLLLMKDNDLILNTVLYLKSNGAPYPLNMDAMDEGLGSAVIIRDSKTNSNFMSVSGTAALKNLKLVETVETTVQLASYTLDIDGQFDLFETGKEVPTRYSGKGKIVISPFNFQ